MDTLKLHYLGEFAKGASVSVTYNSGFYGLGTGISELKTVTGTAERVRTVNGISYLTIHIDKDGVKHPFEIGEDRMERLEVGSVYTAPRATEPANNNTSRQSSYTRI